MNFLIDIIPPKARRYVYGAVALIGLIVTIWQTADGDWKTALTALIASATTAMAHANTDPATKEGDTP